MLLAAALLCGCQSTRYRAATLPDELRAPPTAVTAGRIHLPNLAAATSGSLSISPGDLLDVRVMSGLEEEAPRPQVLQVSERGDVDLPLVGLVKISGLRPSEASQTIAQASIDRGVYRRPNVTLEIRERATHEVTVLGAVAKPGTHELPVGSSNVLAAIAAAGGLTDEAGSEVEVMRQPSPTILAGSVQNTEGGVQQVAYNQPASAEPVMQRIDLAMAGRQAPRTQQLGDHDVVMVLPEKPRVIHVTGLVQKPDQFSLPDDQPVRVLDAIAMAGGRSSQVADKVYVVRQQGDDAAGNNASEPIVIEVSVAKAKKNGKENLVLVPGDLVSVESTAATAAVEVIQSFFRVSLGLTSTAFAL